MKAGLAKIEKIAKGYFVGANACHDWDHVKRVCNLALIIGREEKADLEIIAIASLLHDIKKTEEMKKKGKICHALRGAKEATKILMELGFDRDITQRVEHCIAAHRNKNNVTPTTIEARALFDADKIDSLGAIGIGRTFLFAGKIGARLHNSEVKNIYDTETYGPEDTAYREFMVTLRHSLDKMFTKTGKKIAKRRLQYMSTFFARLDEETKGEL